MPPIRLRATSGALVGTANTNIQNSVSPDFWTPTLPLTTFSPPYVARTGTVRTVNSGGDVQAALTAAVPGDVIVLESGATFTGNFTLPTKTGSGDIYVVNSQVHAGTFGTAAGRRVTSATGQATLRHPGGNNTPVIASVGNGRTGWRFVGITVDLPPSGLSSLSEMIVLGDRTQSNTANYPGRFVFDRCRILGRPTISVRRGISVTGPDFAFLDGQLLEVNSFGGDGDCCGIIFWAFAGNGLVQNTEIVGPTEHVFCGGLDTSSFADLTIQPSDITVRRCYLRGGLYQDEDLGGGSWNGTVYNTKNLFETKAGKRILLEDCVLERHLGKDQQLPIVIKSNFGPGGATSNTNDVTIRNIKLFDANALIATKGFGDDPNVSGLRSVSIDNVAILGSRAVNRITARIIQMERSTRRFSASRITAILNQTQENTAISYIEPTEVGDVMADVRIINSIMGAQYGMQIAGDVDKGMSDLVTGERIISGKVLVGRPFSEYSFNVPGGYPANAATVGFTTYANSASDNLRLATGTTFKGLIGGTDPGCNMDELDTATAGCISGVWP
jgi:hypothetical protein